MRFLLKSIEYNDELLDIYGEYIKDFKIINHEDMIYIDIESMEELIQFIGKIPIENLLCKYNKIIISKTKTDYQIEIYDGYIE